jgi:hypothetical protein
MEILLEKYRVIKLKTFSFIGNVSWYVTPSSGQNCMFFIVNPKLKKNILSPEEDIPKRRQ